MPNNLLADPAWFPDRIDWRNRLVKLTKVKHATLVESPFLDGRTPLNDDPAAVVVLDLDMFTKTMPKPPAMRWMFHESFCGSTLLSRTITIAGHSLCLREPQVLVDLTNWRLAADDAEIPLFNAARDAVLSKLGQTWSANEHIVIKPTNWVNPIIADLWSRKRGDRAIFIRGAAEPFLVAVLRGGKERVAYILGLYNLLAAFRPDLTLLAQAHMPLATEPFERALQIVATFHWLQERNLADACRKEGTTLERSSLIFPDYLDNMVEALTQLSESIEIKLSSEQLRISISNNIVRHSKNNKALDDVNNEFQDNNIIRQNYSKEIERALTLLNQINIASLQGGA